MQFVVFFVKVAWFLGGSTNHLDSIGNKIFFFFFLFLVRGVGQSTVLIGTHLSI